MADPAAIAQYLDPEYCSGVQEIILDVFVVVKAVILIYFSC